LHLCGSAEIHRRNRAICFSFEIFSLPAKMGSFDKAKPFVRVGWLAFAAPSMDFEVIAEVFIPIRLRGYDKRLQETQGADSERYIASVIAGTTVRYAG
jgi:hypothetical protein